jgi:hypothetical protein
MVVRNSPPIIRLILGLCLGIILVIGHSMLASMEGLMSNKNYPITVSLIAKLEWDNPLKQEIF